MSKRVDYSAVADVYKQAALDGRPPTMAVAEHFGVCKSTAGQRVLRARLAGFMEPSSQGYNQSRNPRALAVANALGVDYDALVKAIMEQANGRLCIDRKVDA